MNRAGKILAEYMLNRGREQIAYFNRQMAYGGDQLTIEGICSMLCSHGMGLGSLTLRFLPAASDVYFAAATQLLSLVDGPRGFICRTERMADDVVSAGEQLGLVAGMDFDVAVCDYYLKANELPRYAWPKPLISNEELGRRLAQLLICQATRREETVGTHVVPVELEVPVNAG
jgi:DNA-binding LacI/PurR family transcriptional regulator